MGKIIRRPSPKIDVRIFLLRICLHSANRLSYNNVKQREKRQKKFETYMCLIGSITQAHEFICVWLNEEEKKYTHMKWGSAHTL